MLLQRRQHLLSLLLLLFLLLLQIYLHYLRRLASSVARSSSNSDDGGEQATRRKKDPEVEPLSDELRELVGRSKSGREGIWRSVGSKDMSIRPKSILKSIFKSSTGAPCWTLRVLREGAADGATCGADGERRGKQAACAQWAVGGKWREPRGKRRATCSQRAQKWVGSGECGGYRAASGKRAGRSEACGVQQGKYQRRVAGGERGSGWVGQDSGHQEARRRVVGLVQWETTVSGGRRLVPLQDVGAGRVPGLARSLFTAAQLLPLASNRHVAVGSKSGGRRWQCGRQRPTPWCQMPKPRIGRAQVLQANVLGKAVEYIRVFKNREARLTRLTRRVSISSKLLSANLASLCASSIARIPVRLFSLVDVAQLMHRWPVEAFAATIDERTRAVYVEVIVNMDFSMVDIRALAEDELRKERGVLRALEDMRLRPGRLPPHKLHERAHARTAGITHAYTCARLPAPASVPLLMQACIYRQAPALPHVPASISVRKGRAHRCPCTLAPAPTGTSMPISTSARACPRCSSALAYTHGLTDGRRVVGKRAAHGGGAGGAHKWWGSAGGTSAGKRSTAQVRRRLWPFAPAGGGTHSRAAGEWYPAPNVVRDVRSAHIGQWVAAHAVEQQAVAHAVGQRTACMRSGPDSWPERHEVGAREANARWGRAPVL
ncbi:hypothetical protein GGX14DRAFT_584564 [Mycena pura]|uniref:Uncharacterized protein n=1 Tax=Mycena pura TaxID=153505 RepID=A0AAD7E630_9AGAR|nr:hypothetical protein GGX14DRAFT_584564 [Mycena pura]